MGGKTSSAVHNRYIAKAYDRINFTVPKGEKDRIKDFASAVGESVNGYIWKAVQDRMDKEKAGTE